MSAALDAPRDEVIRACLTLLLAEQAIPSEVSYHDLTAAQERMDKAAIALAKAVEAERLTLLLAEQATPSERR